MGTYTIPRNLKGETRILYIFSLKSLATTGIGVAIGAFFYLIFGVMLGWQAVGIAFIAIFGVIGYVCGMFKIPTLGGLAITKKVGGESIDEILKRYFMFRMQKKKYVYYKITKEDETNG